MGYSSSIVLEAQCRAGVSQSEGEKSALPNTGGLQSLLLEDTGGGLQAAVHKTAVCLLLSVQACLL